MSHDHVWGVGRHTHKHNTLNSGKLYTHTDNTPVPTTITRTCVHVLNCMQSVRKCLVKTPVLHLIDLSVVFALLRLEFDLTVWLSELFDSISTVEATSQIQSTA